MKPLLSFLPLLLVVCVQRITAQPLDPNQQPAATDMNSWDNVHLGSDLPLFQDGRFAVYRAQFTPRAATQKSRGRLVLRDVVGKAQVWIDGKLAAKSRILKSKM